MNNSRIPIAVKASGMVTAVGFNALASCAAMRAGIDGLRETNLWDAESGTYLKAGRVLLPHWWIGTGKLAELIAPAIQECFAAALPVLPSAIPVLLGVAVPDRPFRFAGLDERIKEETEHRLGFQLHPDSKIIARGHVAVADALVEAQQLLHTRRATHCIVAAVDSLIHQELTAYYLHKRRVLTPMNSNGFSPGEAGAALLLGMSDSAEAGELQILGIGTAHEKATIESEAPLKAQGMIDAIAGAFNGAGVTIADLHYRIADLNGEHYKFKEMVLAMMRYERKPKEKLFDLWHPIEYVGDIGAAIGPVILAVALHAGRKGYGTGPMVLCTFGNDDGRRAAIVARYAGGKGGR